MNSVRAHIPFAATALLAIVTLTVSAAAQDSHYRPVGEQLPVPDCLTLSTAYADALNGGYTPCAAGVHESWLKDMSHWRTERKIRIGYDGSRYDLPALQWTQSSFMQPQMMVQDRYLYDPVSGKYTVDRYLDDLEKRLESGEKYLALFTEFPGNPLLKSPDLRRIRELADKYDFLVVIDETVGNFLNVNVLPYADVVASSLTKVFSGDSNVMGGR